jgi:hypothetical protein
MSKIFAFFVFIGLAVVSLTDCRKLVAIPPPTNTLTTSQVFSTDALATEAMTEVYYNMINSSGLFQEDATIYGGASADEFLFFNQGSITNIEFQKNAILSNNNIAGTMWQTAYNAIYGCNAVIAGVNASTGVHDSVKNELIGEAEFTRAFSYFYLVNFYGSVPLVLTTNYNVTRLLSNSTSATTYAQIIADLKDAEGRLAPDYSVAGGQRIVPNKWAAIALLARVYLYTSDWVDAAAQASTVIGNQNLYALVPNLQNVFLINSQEAIWQLQQSNSVSPFYNGTPEAALIIPKTQTSFPPLVYMTSVLVASFEDSDMRRTEWVDSTVYMGQVYYYPYKYEYGPAQDIDNGSYAEYYMVLRLAEQYLIRAEAEANGAGGGINAAINDMDTIRLRAGLGVYSGSQNEDSVLAAIYHERQVELFAEWGHRWLDLKRWADPVQILSNNKGITVSSSSLLFPIPSTELTSDPNLAQNPGYQ